MRRLITPNIVKDCVEFLIARREPVTAGRVHRLLAHRGSLVTIRKFLPAALEEIQKPRRKKTALHKPAAKAPRAKISSA